MATSNGNRLVPPAGTPAALAEEQHTAQAKLRAAVFNAVSETDVKEVVEGIVQKAKEGDKVATKYLFDYVLGGSVTTAVQNNVYIDGSAEPDKPLDSPPGSPSRIEQLRERVANGHRLFGEQESQPDLS